jgi:hypothetical protein
MCHTTDLRVRLSQWSAHEVTVLMTFKCLSVNVSQLLAANGVMMIICSRPTAGTLVREGCQKHETEII